MRDEPSRCCNDDVRPAREILALEDHVLATDDDANVQVHRLADHSELKIKLMKGLDKIFITRLRAPWLGIAVAQCKRMVSFLISREHITSTTQL